MVFQTIHSLPRISLRLHSQDLSKIVENKLTKQDKRTNERTTDERNCGRLEHFSLWYPGLARQRSARSHHPPFLPPAGRWGRLSHPYVQWACIAKRGTRKHSVITKISLFERYDICTKNIKIYAVTNSNRQISSLQLQTKSDCL